MDDIKKRTMLIKALAAKLRSPMPIRDFTRTASELFRHKDIILGYGLLAEKEMRECEDIVREIEFSGRRGKDFLRYADKLVRMMKTLETRLMEKEEGIVSGKRDYGFFRKTALGLAAVVGLGGLFGGPAVQNSGRAYAMEASASVPADMYENIAKRMEKLNAEKKYDAVIELAKDYAEQPDNRNGYFYNNLGEAQYYLKNYSAAIENLEKAIKFLPNFDDPYLNLGQIYAFKLKDSKKASKYLNAYLRLTDNSHPQNVKSVRDWLLKTIYWSRCLKSKLELHSFWYFLFC